MHLNTQKTKAYALLMMASSLVFFAIPLIGVPEREQLTPLHGVITEVAERDGLWRDLWRAWDVRVCTRLIETYEQSVARKHR